MALTNGDGRWNVQEPVQHLSAGLGYASGNSGAVGFTAGLRETGIAVRALRGSGDDAKSNGRAEDLEVVMVDLVFQASFTDLVQAVKLVEIHGVTVRHNQPVENHRQPALAETLHFAGFAQSKC